MKILIVDDHAVVRRGVRQILADALEGATFGEAGDAVEAIAALREEPCQVMLLDIALPGKRGPELLQQVKRESPATAVLIFSIYPAEQYAVRLIKSGASGFLGKECEPGELIEAVRAAARGKHFITPEVGELLARRMALGEQEEGGKPHEGLSDREYEVFIALAGGLSLTEIARRMSLSVKTVSSYRGRICEKLGIEHNAELTRYAVHHRLLD